MTRDEAGLRHADRLELLLEVASIDLEIAKQEIVLGPSPKFEDLRRRVQRVRAVVLEQLRGPRAAERMH